MTLFLICSFFVFFGLALISVRSQPPDAVLFGGILWILTLVFVVSTKGVGYDLDSPIYMEIFDDVDVYNYKDWLNEKSIEPFFILATIFFKGLGLKYWAVNLFFVGASVALYFYAFRRHGWRHYLIFFLFYFATGFLVREFTQIRFGLSVAFGVAAISDALDRRHFRASIFVIASVMAHSAGYFVFVYLFAVVFSRFVSLKALIIFFLALLLVYFVFARAYVESYLFSIPRISRYTDSSEMSSSLSWSLQCILFVLLAAVAIGRQLIGKDVFAIALVAFFLQVCFWNFQIIQRSTVYGFVFMGFVLARLLMGGSWGRLVAGIVVLLYFPSSFGLKLGGLVL